MSPKAVCPMHKDLIAIGGCPMLVVVPWGCDFKGCDFKGCGLKGCDFKGCDLNPKPSARMNPKPSAHHQKPYSA